MIGWIGNGLRGLHRLQLIYFRSQPKEFDIFILMVKKSVPVASGKAEGCMRSTSKSTRFKGLHHLPPDILRGIMSRLTLKEAVRLSILSKKWKRLWKCYPKLVFTRATMRSTIADTTGHRKPMRTRFIRVVNSILRQLRSTNLDKFVVRFPLRKRHTHHIDRWLKFSAASRTKHVVLDLCPGPKGSSDMDDKYSFPLDMFDGSCVKNLCLGFVLLTLPSDFSGFKNLKKVSLDMVGITGELQCLLPECPVLEWLSITRCRLVGLSISQQLSRLLFLRVQGNNLQRLNIQAPNLTTFEFKDKLIPIVLGESLNISKAEIDLFSSLDCFDYVFSELANPRSHVQSLSVNCWISGEVCAGIYKKSFQVTNLRHVVLKIDISGRSRTSPGILRLAYLLELAPVLEELVLHMCGIAPAMYVSGLSESYFPPCPHRHLKTVRMTGVYGYHGQLALALYILHNATCLEHMIIDPVVRNNLEVPPLKFAQQDIINGRWFARYHLLNKGFDKVLTIL
ncbi:hypothetical protein ACP4OV_026002 [Aristida adscensionis]